MSDHLRRIRIMPSNTRFVTGNNPVRIDEKLLTSKLADLDRVGGQIPTTATDSHPLSTANFPASVSKYSSQVESQRAWRVGGYTKQMFDYLELPWAEAVAIKNDRIVYVGSIEGTGAFVGEGTVTHHYLYRWPTGIYDYGATVMLGAR